jgi:Kyakuja-Dileera-Zisupton transposase
MILNASIASTVLPSSRHHFLVDIVKRVVGCIPQMHIQNHKDDCQYQFSFAYTEGVGCTCGEIVETPWVESNQTSGSTKKQNSGHHYDSLDHFHSHWNWEKLFIL